MCWLTNTTNDRLINKMTLFDLFLLATGVAMDACAVAMAKGTTTIEDIDHIRRGYERIVEKFASLGADIRLVLD